MKTPPIFVADEYESPSFENTQTVLERLIEASDRLNILVLGVEDSLADTMMLVSYSPSDQLLDIVSIPRDTYHHIPGHDRSDQKKLNAIYGFKGYGSKGLKEEITKLLDIPISYYVKVDYKDAENVIDVLGGVEITVAKHMVYDDPLNTPPLHIDIPAGKQVLSGENAIKYLRWRQDNDMVGDGDLGRIQRQQKFMVAAIRKALSFRLPVVAKTAFQYIKTDMTLNTTIYYASLAIEFDFKNIKTYQLPGTQAYMEGGCFVVSDTVQTTELMESIYNRVPSQGL